MDEEKKYYSILSLLLLSNSTLLLVKLLQNVIMWNTNADNLFLDILGLMWPIIGFCAAFEFLRKKRDKWGWGGILFHFFVLYCMIYYLILTIQAIASLSLEISSVLSLTLNIAITSIGWFTYLFYYD